MAEIILTAGLFLLAAPAFLLPGAALMAERCALWLLLEAAALLLGLAARLLPRRLRAAGVALACGLVLLLSVLAGRAFDIGLYWIIPALLGCAAAAVEARLSAEPRSYLAMSFWYMGIGAYLVSRILGAMSPLPALPGPLHICGILFFIFLTLLLSMQSLEGGMDGGRGPSRRMKTRCLLMASGLAALLLILTHLSALKDLLQRAITGVIRAAAWLLAMIEKLFGHTEEDGGGGGGEELMGMLEPSDPSPFLVFLEKLLHYVMTAVLFFAAAAFLVLVFRVLRRGLRRLTTFLRRYADSLSDAYEDSVESLMDWGEVRRAFRGRERRLKEKLPPWEQLNPRQKVRRSYRDFLARHPALPPRSTARQALENERLSCLYEAARYSSREITSQEAEESRGMGRQK